MTDPDIFGVYCVRLGLAVIYWSNIACCACCGQEYNSRTRHTAQIQSLNGMHRAYTCIMGSVSATKGVKYAVFEFCYMVPAAAAVASDCQLQPSSTCLRHGAASSCATSCRTCYTCCVYLQYLLLCFLLLLCHSCFCCCYLPCHLPSAPDLISWCSGSLCCIALQHCRLHLGPFAACESQVPQSPLCCTVIKKRSLSHHVRCPGE